MEMVNTKKIVALLAEMGNVGDKIGRTKNWGELMMLVDEVGALTSVEWDKLKEEAEKGDRAELKSFFEAKLDLADDKLEEVVEKAVGGALMLADLVMVFVSYGKK